ncbi:hypothetical protein BC834DRAFT_971253 [Gloeopeniophorella convolvens]|nr:hypothetical protein BC834DRAFT_971253 [Gloeopeniophorella convolvens]
MFSRTSNKAQPANNPPPVPSHPSGDQGRPSANTGPSSLGAAPSASPPAPPRERKATSHSSKELDGGSFPATETIKDLIGVVRRDVYSLRRNAQVSYLAVDRARDLANAIDGHIKKVEQSPLEEWSSFEKYSRAIIPLEDLLLELFDNSEEEKALYLGDHSSITTIASSPEIWESNRNKLSECLRKLLTQSEFTYVIDDQSADARDQERLWAQAHDDKELFSELSSATKDRLSRISSLHQPTPSVGRSLDELQDRFTESPHTWYSSGFSVVAIKAGLLATGVLGLLQAAPPSNKSLDHFRSAAVWNGFSNVFQLLKAVPTGNTDTSRVEDAYKALLGALQFQEDSGITTQKSPGRDSTPSVLLDIVKAAASIRPPYRGQAFALVTFCHQLAESNYFSNLSSKETKDFVDLLTEFLDFLRGPCGATFQPKAFRDPASFENDTNVRLLEKEKEMIRIIFKASGLSEAELKKMDQTFASARQRDKENAQKLNGPLGKISSSDSEAHRNVTVSVAVFDREGKPLPTVTLVLDSGAVLSAVLWEVARKLTPDKMESVTSGEVMGQGSDQSLSLRIVLP